MLIDVQVALKVYRTCSKEVDFQGDEAGRLRGLNSWQPCPAYFSVNPESDEARTSNMKSDRNERIFPKRLAKFGIVR
jgi:hypothetical protein